MRGTIGILAAFLFLAISVRAEEKSVSDLVARYVRELGSAKFVERDQAARELVRIGEPALKPLQFALASPDMEVRERAGTLIKVIEGAVRNEALIRSPKIWLKYDKKPLDEALADLARKTGLPFALDSQYAKNSKEPITLDTGEVPFWVAVERFLDVAGLTESLGSAAGQAPGSGNPAIDVPQRRVMIRRYQSTVPMPMQQPTNNFRLIEGKSATMASMNSIVRIKALPRDFPGNRFTKGSNEIQLTLDVTPAPSMTWQGTINIEVRRAIDERGRTVTQSHLRTLKGAFDPLLETGGAVQINGQVVQFGGQFDLDSGVSTNQFQGNPRHASLTLLGNDSSSKMLKELEGVLTAQVLAPAQAFLSIDNLLTADMKEPIQCGAYSLKINERKTENDRYTHLRFTLSAPLTAQTEGIVQQLGGGLVPVSETVPANNQAVLTFLDSKGKEIKNHHLSLIEQSFDGRNQVSNYLVVLPPQGKKGEASSVKLSLVGRQSVMVEVPFVLKNVPLP